MLFRENILIQLILITAIMETERRRELLTKTLFLNIFQAKKILMIL